MNVNIYETDDGKPERVYTQVGLSAETVEYAVADVLKLSYENAQREAEAVIRARGGQPGAARMVLIYEVAAA